MKEKEVRELMQAYSSVYNNQYEPEGDQIDEIKTAQTTANDRIPDFESNKKTKQVPGLAVKKPPIDEEYDLFDYLLEYLVAEGYADTNDSAIAIMANMSEEWKNSVVEETRRTAYLQKKFNRENQRKSGSAHTSIPGKQNTGQALEKARESERHMRGER